MRHRHSIDIERLIRQYEEWTFALEGERGGTAATNAIFKETLAVLRRFKETGRKFVVIEGELTEKDVAHAG